MKAGYIVLLEAAVTTMPKQLIQILGLKSKPGAQTVGRTAVRSLRWALGYSPSWALALRRNDAEIPWDMFNQAPRVTIEPLSRG
jgi:hypothetical protein